MERNRKLSQIYSSNKLEVDDSLNSSMLVPKTRKWNRNETIQVIIRDHGVIDEVAAWTDCKQSFLE